MCGKEGAPAGSHSSVAAPRRAAAVWQRDGGCGKPVAMTSGARARWRWGVAVAPAILAVLAARACVTGAPAPAPPTAGRPGVRADGAAAASTSRPAAADAVAPALAPDPSAGWETEAEALAADLRRTLDGRPRPGAYLEARAEAARADLALFPPDRARVRRLLAGSERDRTLALAALAARPELDDDLLRLVLRSQRPDDDDVVRLLGAEIAAAVAPDLGARHEDDLLNAFAAEPNPLVLAVALPALERMGEARLRALLRAQLASASPEMLPVLLALARARLGAEALEELAVTVPLASASRP